MNKINITNEDKNEFKNTQNGMRKSLWMRIGMLIDFLATIVISLIIINSKEIDNSLIFYLTLYVCLVIVVVGGEFIGTYFGALEQYVLDKKSKKEINIEE